MSVINYFPAPNAQNKLASKRALILIATISIANRTSLIGVMLYKIMANRTFFKLSFLCCSGFPHLLNKFFKLFFFVLTLIKHILILIFFDLITK